MEPRFALLLPLAALCVAGAAVAQDPPAAETPAAETQVPRELARQAAKEIKVVTKEGDASTILDTLREYGRIADTDVVRAVGKLVDDERPEVRWAAVRTLRYNPDPKAGSELIAAAKDKGVRADEALYAEVLRGIGQHGDPRALSLLADGLGPSKEPPAVLAARIDAVGRIRTPDAVDELIKFARSGFAKGREVRVCTALKGLTGEDHGDEMRPWVLWWNRAKLGYRFPENPGPVPATWERIWRTPDPARLFDHDQDPIEERPERGGGRRGGGREGGGGGREGGEGTGRGGGREGGSGRGGV